MTDPGTNEAQPKSGLWLALRVLDEPTQVFHELASRPRYLVPLLCAVIVAVVSAFVVPQDVYEEQLRPRFDRAVEQGQMTQEEADEQLANLGGVGMRAIGAATGAAGQVVWILVVAGVLTLIFGAMGAEPVGFKREFGVVSHAWMVVVAGSVLMLLLMLFAGMRQPLSLGFLFSEDAGFPYQFANRITLFGAWNVFLLALGNKILTNSKGIGGAIAVVGGLWLVLLIPMALLGGLFG